MALPYLDTANSVLIDGQPKWLLTRSIRDLDGYLEITPASDPFARIVVRTDKVVGVRYVCSEQQERPPINTPWE